MIEKTVIEYIKSEKAQYAILIDGEWGSGKTYYWKNILSQRIMDSFSEEVQEKKLIYISLYGVSSISEIEKRLFFELLPSFSKKNLFPNNINQICSLAKSVLSGLVMILTKRNITKILNDINLKALISLKPSKHILCFDDLERIDNSLNVSNVLGFINSFVEHDKIKTIIITHEKELFNKNNENVENQYKVIKEKVIGRTLCFKQNNTMIIQTLVNSHFDLCKILGKYPKTEFILKYVFESGGNKNIRNLKFALELLDNIIKILNKTDNIKISEELLYRIVVLTLAISFEYKKGNILNETDLSTYNLTTTDKFEIFLMTDRDNYENSTFKTVLKFRELYFDPLNIEYIYIDSICKYIILGHLVESDLLNDIKRILHKEPHIESLERLHKFLDLEDSEVNKLFVEVREYIHKNSYNLTTLVDIAKLFFLLKYHEILNFDDDLLMQEIDKAIKHKIDTKEYISNLEQYVSESSRRPYSKKVNRLIELAKITNEKVKHILHEDEIKNNLENLNGSHESFIKVLTDIQERNEIKPILKDYPAELIGKTLLNSNNKKIHFFYAFLDSRYLRNVRYLHDEKEFLNTLFNHINQELRHSEKEYNKINILNLNRIKNKLEVILKNMVNTQ